MENALKLATKHDSHKESHSTTLFIMTQEGRIFGDYREDGNIIHEVNAYGQILNSYVLGVNCVRVLRHRVTTVQETYTLEA